jgi:hypothetical protein
LKHKLLAGLKQPASGAKKTMDDALQAQIETYLSRLNGLIRRGRELRDALAANPSDSSVIMANRLWQQDCGVTVTELSGSSKSHWLARAFSEAFLLRSESGNAAAGAAPDEIVKRLLDVLDRAVASLSQKDDSAIISASSEAPSPRRFEFVHNVELQPVLEQAYKESRRALEHGLHELALKTACGILEAIVTDALEHKGLSALAGFGVPAGKIADWSFQTRVTVAERAGLIGGGCARLPAIAWAYRDRGESGGTATVSEREAQHAGQVLRVVMRDLDPGR